MTCCNKFLTLSAEAGEDLPAEDQPADGDPVEINPDEDTGL